MSDPVGPRAAPPGEPEPQSFEVALARLETIVSELEGGELALEEALAVFEEGVRLSRRCAEQLERVERRIEVLVGPIRSEVRPLDAGEGS